MRGARRNLLPSRYSTTAATSARMRQVKRHDTKPELVVRAVFRSLARRFSSNVGGLPGKPDFCIRAEKKVVFVHGCYWHRHTCAKGLSLPKRNQPLWNEKFARTKARDRAARHKLHLMGWRSLILWECELRGDDWIERLTKFLSKTE
jgi:DNA mismatch endonuclease (patch repair protein)